MKYALFFLSFFIICASLLFGQNGPQFEDYFENSTMRIDYFHIADAESETITIDKIYKQGIWAGNRQKLLDYFNQGRYYVKIYDLETDQLLFSKGFDSYCGEYRTSGPARRGIKRTYHESVLIPFPKRSIRFTLETRKVQNELVPLFSQEIDPDSTDIIIGGWVEDVRVFEAAKSGQPHQKVDMAIVGEGYTKNEQFIFVEDLHRFAAVLFNHEPYKSHKNKFNIYGVLKFSEESGTDQPRADIYKSTVMNTTFNSMGSARYLLTEDNKSLRDIAAHVPYDALLIMVNHDRYGGGGIYNFYLTFTTNNQWNEYIFIHEFGHSFAGLADEYYTSSTAYEEFYPGDVEPLEPNITALLNTGRLKWEKFVSPGIEIPTPWRKAQFDSMSIAYQQTREELNQKIAKLKREKASSEEIEELEKKSEELSKENAEEVDRFFTNSPYAGKVGAFEGAGYTSRGMYRPMLDCIMFSKGSKPFCKVCEDAILKIIEHYTE